MRLFCLLLCYHATIESVIPERVHAVLGAGVYVCLLTCTCPQAGNGVYELTDRIHPGGGNTFENLCAGNGRSKGKPLKSVGWADIIRFHPYVSYRASSNGILRVHCQASGVACDSIGRQV